MPTKKMTLDEWKADAQKRLDAFVENWRQENAKNPKHWPIAMAPGEWDEQFRITESI